jgi:hypothetical protein
VRKLARRAVRKVVRTARLEDQVGFAALLAEHLAVDTSELEVVGETWPQYDLVNVQAGLDAWLAEPGRAHRLVGVVNYRHREFGLSQLFTLEMHGPMPGNVSRTNMPSGPDGQVRACVRCGLYLVTEGERRAALLVRAAEPDAGISRVSVQIAADDPAYAADDPAYAAAVAARLRELAVEHNVYRGHVVSFGRSMFGEREAVLQFHTRPSLPEEHLILPEETIAAVHRQVVGVARHRDRLLAARQHLKRGLLLYGPPGVGKTHTVRYLVGRLTATTVLELSGESLYLIGEACSVARTLQPAMIVVEDVDLIAEERDLHPGNHPLLFRLLNEMDGLAEDADVVFLLTTNRADMLEPALAARPGRVDQAVELRLPDEDARRRLFRLYRGDLDVDESRLDSVVARTAGVTASFLKELLRRAAVVAAESTGPTRGPEGSGGSDGRLRVSADQLDAALDELLDTRNAMTRVLLGGRRE